MRARPVAPSWATSALPGPVLCALLLLTLGPATADAQYRISQRGTVSQKLGNTLVSVDYSRPLARGRDDLFGMVVIWGELWTPGANEASVFEVSDTVQLNGHTVPAGRWSMWIIPSRVGPWELVLDGRDSLFHTQRPELTDEQIRFVVETTHEGEHVEALTWEFPRIAQDGATLLMSWGATRIPLEVRVKSLEPTLTISAADAQPYLGEWQVTFTPPPPDSGAAPPAPPPTVLTVRHHENMLLGAFPPGAFGPPPDAPKPDTTALAKLSPQEREREEAKIHLSAMDGGAWEYVLVPGADGIFLMGWIDDGVLMDVSEVFHEFEIENRQAVRLTVRDDKDRVIGTGVRVAR